MKNYQRITKKGVRYDEVYLTDTSSRRVKNFSEYASVYNRLAELEDKIKNGMLIFIDEPFYSECNNCWAVFQRTDDNVITCRMTEQQARNYKFRGIENEPL